MMAFDEKLGPDDELLSVYLDGEATPAECAAVERRLASDPAARRLLDELRAASQAVRALPRGTLPRQFADEVLAAVAPADAPRTTASRPASVFTDAEALPGASGWRRGGIWASLALAAALLLMLTRPEEPPRPGPQGLDVPREFELAQAQPAWRPPAAARSEAPEDAAAPAAEPAAEMRAESLADMRADPLAELPAGLPADAPAAVAAAPAEAGENGPIDSEAMAELASSAPLPRMRAAGGAAEQLSLEAAAGGAAAPPEEAAAVGELAYGALPRGGAGGGLGGIRGPDRFQQPAAVQAFSEQLAEGAPPAGFARSAPAGPGVAAVPAAPAADGAVAIADDVRWDLASAEPPQQVVLRLAEERRGDGTLERLLAEQGLDAQEGVQRAAGRRALSRDAAAAPSALEERADSEELALVASPQQIAGLLEAVAADETLCQDIAYPEVEQYAFRGAAPPPVAALEPSREMPSRWYALQQQVRQRWTRGLAPSVAGDELLQRKSATADAAPAADFMPTADAKRGAEALAADETPRVDEAPREIVLQIEWVAPAAPADAGQASPED